MKNLFTSGGNLRPQVTVSPMDELLTHIRSSVQQRGGRFAEDGVVKAAVALESFSNETQASLNSSIQDLQGIIRAASTNNGFKFGSTHTSKTIGDTTQITLAQESAGIAAGVMASNPKAALMSRSWSAAQLSAQFGRDENTTVVGHEGNSEAMDTRPLFDGRTAVEAYDERNNRDAVAYSVTYNVAAARQDEFGEAFYPTVTVTPDNVGFVVSIRLNYVQNEVRRALTGALSNFGRINILKAVVDATILRNDQTKIVPIVRTGGANDSTAAFVATGDVAPYSVVLDQVNVTTAPLKIGKKVELLGLSQTDAMLASGVLDQTDAIDSSVRFGALYIKLGTAGGSAVVKFDVSKLPGSDWNFSVQGNTRQLTSNFDTTALRVTTTTTKVDGTAITQLSALTDKVVRLGTSAFGNLVQDTGYCVVNSPEVTVASVTDTSGNVLDLTAGAGATIAAVFAGATVIGYDLLCFRTNSNRRQRGQLVDTQHVNHVYTVPFLPPISSLRPVGDSDANDSGVVQGLLNVTRIRTSNSAVTALLEARDVLKAYVSDADLATNQPEILGVARYVVKAQYKESVIDCSVALDSLTSSQRAEDLVSLLINTIRDMVYTMYTSSAYKAAADAMFDGAAPKPLIIIGTDPTIARYLTLVGDTRTFGDQFDFKIVSTLDSRLSGKIFVTLGCEQAYGSGTPNPLHFGAMAWSPEATVMMPITRNGAISHELTVSPRFRHVTNLPILGVLTVTNIPAVVTGKVTLAVSQ